MNKVILVGNLTRDIEIRYSGAGLAIGKTGIATNRRFKTQTGEMKDEVMFVDITFFGKTAETASKYFRKGSKILIEGRLSLEQWQDQSGQKKTKHSVIVESLEFIVPKNMNQNSTQQNTSSYNNSYNGGSNGNSGNNMGGYNNQNQPPQSQQPKTQYQSPVPEIDVNQDMDDQVPF
jgi:single-strand DNA-binding protein